MPFSPWQKNLRFLAVFAAVAASEHDQRFALALPTCSSSRPNSWAAHRTLKVPRELFSSNDRDEKWARALCCVYTHVEKSNGGLSRPQMRTYDGSKYSINADSFVEAAERAMDDICDMSMGADDCRRRRECVNDALSSPSKNNVDTVATTACRDNQKFSRGKKTCQFLSSNSKRRRRLCKRSRFKKNCPETCGTCS